MYRKRLDRGEHHLYQKFSLQNSIDQQNMYLMLAEDMMKKYDSIHVIPLAMDNFDYTEVKKYKKNGGFMKIYEKNNNVLSVYDLEIDRSALLEYRQEHSENVKGVVINYNSDNRREINLVNNKQIIFNYIFGLYDDINPFYITHEDNMKTNFDFDSMNSVFLFEDLATEGVLLSGVLADIHSVIKGNVNLLDFLEKNNYDEELLSLIKIKRLKDINLDDLDLLLDENIIQYDASFESRLEKYNNLISHYKKYVAKELGKVKKLGVSFDCSKKYF